MSVKALTTKYRPVVTRTVRWSIPVAVDDTAGVVPDMPAAASGGFGMAPRNPFMFRPARVTLEYRQEGDDAPQITVTVSGRRVKKDGTCGHANASTHYVGAASLALMPQWLADLIIDEVGQEVVVQRRHYPDLGRGAHSTP